MTGGHDGLISAYRFDGTGSMEKMDWRGVEDASGDPNAPLWIHLNRKSPRAKTWLTKYGHLDPIAARALMEEDTRPRFSIIGGGALLNLRAVNLNPGATPDDMVSLRFWIEHGRLITAWARPVQAVSDVRSEIEQGHAPKSVGQLVVNLAQAIMKRMDPVLLDLDDQLDGLEETVLENASRAVRSDLIRLRRQAVTLRRYIASQKEALHQLIHADVSWLGARDQVHLRDILDQNTRYVENLDSFRERSSILQDELTSRLAERMDRQVFRLSLVATLFLPLTFVTGLLGINVGGLPGSDHPYAFYVVCGALFLLLVAELWFFRRSRLRD